MPVGLFRGEEGWVQVDYGTGTTIPVPRSNWAAEKKKEDDAKGAQSATKICRGEPISPYS